MFCGPAEQGLEQKQQGHQKKPGAGTLSWRNLAAAMGS